MSKFCYSCGNEIQDMDVFCEHCGAKQAMPETQVEQDAYEALQMETPQSQPQANPVGMIKKNSKIVWICAGAAVGIILLIVILSVVFTGMPYKSTVDTYFDVAFNGNYEHLEELAPQEYWESREKNAGVTVDQVADAYEEDNVYGRMMESLEEDYGRNVKLSHQIAYAIPLSNGRLDTIRDGLKSNYDIARRDVKEAYNVGIEITVSGSKDRDKEETEIIVAKINNRWYVVTSSGYISLLWSGV